METRLHLEISITYIAEQTCLKPLRILWVTQNKKWWIKKIGAYTVLKFEVFLFGFSFLF